MSLAHTTHRRAISAGSPDRLGAVLSAQGTNFAVFSQHAREVFLLLFESADGAPTDVIKLEAKTENVRHVFVAGVKAGQLYGYRVDGDYDPSGGLRFNPHKLLIDPYAKALTGPYRHRDQLLYAYDVNAPEKDLVLDRRDNSAVVPKCIVVDDAFDWQEDKKPNLRREDLLIYETHVKGFTAHPSSGVKHPGTYLGFIEKIPYLKELGINAVELLPIHEFYVQDYILQKGLTNYWGYDSIGFFAPAGVYGTGQHPGCQVKEFKTLVREMHKAGLEVILDVVYNHTAEGNELGPTLCYKGFDNPHYYYLMQNTPEEPYRYYRNDSGCGNTFNVENPPALRTVLDSLRYWVEVMHVDGFRFDLATIVTRMQGQFSPEAAFLKAVAADPVLKNVKMIAEPWDLTTYQVGNLPKGWMEWNGKFRDTVRKFNKGDDHQAGEVAKRFTGSSDFYGDKGRPAWEGVNFITCHDGFTLHDLYSYNEKHNAANGEDNRDGADHNDSWNCGSEGDTHDPGIHKLRTKMVKNALCYLFFSCGTPMLLSGDEVRRSQKGNNNVWCQDNDLSWFDWSQVQTNSEILEFCKKAIRFRHAHPLLGPNPQLPDIAWFDKRLRPPRWEHRRLKTICFQFKSPGQDYPTHDLPWLFFVLNAHHQGCVVFLPQPEGIKWFRLVDTSRPVGDDFRLGREKILRRQHKHHCPPRSFIILIGKKI